MADPTPEEQVIAGRLIERLLVDPGFRAEFRRDPVGVCLRENLPGLASELGGSGRAGETLELRESRSSLAGVVMAAAVEGLSVAEAHALVGHGVGRGVRLPRGVRVPRGVLGGGSRGAGSVLRAVEGAERRAGGGSASGGSSSSGAGGAAAPAVGAGGAVAPAAGAGGPAAALSAAPGSPAAAGAPGAAAPAAAAGVRRWVLCRLGRGVRWLGLWVRRRVGVRRVVMLCMVRVVRRRLRARRLLRLLRLLRGLRGLRLLRLLRGLRLLRLLGGLRGLRLLGGLGVRRWGLLRGRRRVWWVLVRRRGWCLIRL